ncbi:MAG TPA: DNA polymerase IV [Candidatus Poseidoniaceae archaeon]|nr:MAG TPA: DNA polymerase IV [Candidatus Poseidoniales archaeon]HII11599.1 DNA polymerase IV [Candidatus Poseidoniaceae archaeon]|tara:strand:- start:1077 stop:2210 length:1134 start_codon:yes stop_codon:yes gene_type:complete
MSGEQAPPANEQERILIHCDLDAFFASVEILHRDLDPERPLIIGSDPKGGRGRGIVSTCNYAARTYGIRSAMPIGEAWRRCPGAPFGPGHYINGTRGLYSRASRKVMAVLRKPAEHFEKAGIDEAYLDVTKAVGGDWDAAYALCRKLQASIESEVGLTASFGIAPTRILAKMSSEINKPKGIFRLLPDETLDFFTERSLRDVPGIGPKRATQLAEWGFNTVDEAYEIGEIALGRIAGERFASWLVRVVDGTTSREVSPLRSRKSIGKENTFSSDQNDQQMVLGHLKHLVQYVMTKAKEVGVSGRLCEVKIRYTGFETHTHGRSIPVAMDDIDVFSRLAERLFALNVDHGRPIRLIGFRLGQLDMPSTRQAKLLLEEE